MRVLFLSDIHIHPDHPSPAEHFCDFLDNVKVDKLVILGDLFDFWWSVGAPPELYNEVLQVLERCKARGIELLWLPGNHDFDLRRWSSFQAVVERCPAELKLGSSRVRVIHGDEILEQGSYLRWRAFFQGRLFCWLMDCLGQYAWRVAQRLSNYHPESRSISESVLQQQREWAASQDANVIVMGHSHHCGEECAAGRQIYWLGDWCHHRSGLLWEAGKWSLCTGLGTEHRACTLPASDSDQPS